MWSIRPRESRPIALFWAASSIYPGESQHQVPALRAGRAIPGLGSFRWGPRGTNILCRGLANLPGALLQLPPGFPAQCLPLHTPCPPVLRAKGRWGYGPALLLENSPAELLVQGWVSWGECKKQADQSSHRLSQTSAATQQRPSPSSTRAPGLAFFGNF